MFVYMYVPLCKRLHDIGHNFELIFTICVADAGPLNDELYCFWKKSAQQNHKICGENVPPKSIFGV